MHLLAPIAALAAALLSVSMAGSARASFTLEGDAATLTLEADAVTRSEVVAAIVEKFGLEIFGESVEDGTVSGRFSGNLGHVLKSILPSNGYAIAYRDGRPVRVTFTGRSEGGNFSDPSGLGLPPTWSTRPMA